MTSNLQAGSPRWRRSRTSFCTASRWAAVHRRGCLCPPGAVLPGEEEAGPASPMTQHLRRFDPGLRPKASAQCKCEQCSCSTRWLQRGALAATAGAAPASSHSSSSPCLQDYQQSWCPHWSSALLPQQGGAKDSVSRRWRPSLQPAHGPEGGSRGEWS